MAPEYEFDPREIEEFRLEKQVRQARQKRADLRVYFQKLEKSLTPISNFIRNDLENGYVHGCPVPIKDRRGTGSNHVKLTWNDLIDRNEFLANLSEYQSLEAEIWELETKLMVLRKDA